MARIFRKSLILIAAAMLLFGACFAIYSSAKTEEAKASSGEVGSDDLMIVSKNVSYSSKLHLLYAIPADAVAEGETLRVFVYKGDPSLSELSYIIENSTLTQITLGGETKNYYVFKSLGVAAKETADPIYAVPVLEKENGETVVGRATKYSVIEYCYERLCQDGFDSITNEDSKDMLRRRLYEALLNYAEKAYVLFGSSAGYAPSTVRYCSIKGSLSDSFGITSEGTVTATYSSESVPENYCFSGWKVTRTLSSGECSVEVYNTSSVTVSLSDGGTSIHAIYEMDPDYKLSLDIADAAVRDEQNKAQQWEKLEAAFISKLGYSAENAKNIIAELKNLYTLYGSEMVSWAASLYSKGYMDAENSIYAGGFYASASGRDAYGYGPDLQSSVQLIRFLMQSGIIDDPAKDFPEWMQIELIYFAKSLQHENGYFYHPQWGKELTDTMISRRGRDLGWGVSLLEFFGVKPQYDTPTGIIGDGVSADEYLESLGISKYATSQLTSRLGGSVKSKVLLVSDAVKEEEKIDSSTLYLRSNVAFIDYLITTIDPGMRTSPYGTGNILNATNGQIKYYAGINGTYRYTEGDEAATPGATAEDYMCFDGMNMTEMMMAVLIRTVNPVTGLYGGYQSDGNWSSQLNFSNSNGFFKVIGLFGSSKIAYPEAARAAVSLIDNLTNPDLPSTSNACDVFNVWSAINSLDSNVASANTVYAIVTDGNITVAEEGDEGAVAMTVKSFIAKTLELRGAEAIRITFDKIKGYKKADGGFSHSYYHGTTSHQGLPIALAGNNLSDVDGTCIASTGLVRNIFDSFNLVSYRPDFFGEADYLYFINYIENASPIGKANENFLTEDFEDSQLKNKIEGDVSIEGGKLTVSGEASIETSTYSNVGLRHYIKLTLSVDSSAEFKIYAKAQDGAKEFEVDSFTVTKEGEIFKLLRESSGSYANIELKDGKAELAFAYSVIKGGLLCELLVDDTPIMSENVYCEAESLNDIRRISIASEHAVIDDMLFGIITPTYSITNDSGRIDFSMFVDGELDEMLASGSISFVNQTPAGVNQSHALIISEDGNKFLRLDDNFGQGSSMQNFFDFKGNLLGAEVAVFEARMRIRKETGGSIPITILGRSGAAYYAALNMRSGILEAGVFQKKSFPSASFVKTDVKEGEWFTLRVEYRAGEIYSADTFRCSIYINGDLIAESSAEHIGLDYASADSVKSIRMACDTAWIGDIDYDDIYFGSLENYVEPAPVVGHIHILDKEITEYKDSTCTEGGSYISKTFCKAEGCGAVFSVVYNKILPSCKGGEAVVEDFKNSQCYEDGGYYEVIYCKDCGKELERSYTTIPASHTPEYKEENTVSATCYKEGSYELVCYCTECKAEISRKHLIIPFADHTVVNGSCTECGAENFTLFGNVSFEDIEEKVYLNAESQYTTHQFSAENGSWVNAYSPKGVTEVSIVTEGDNKILVAEKMTNDTNSNTWVDMIRSASTPVDIILFETRFKYSTSNTGSGIYVRLYTGRNNSGGGTRLTYHTLKTKSSYNTDEGVQTHAKANEWCTIMITLVPTEDGYLYSFLVKNETEAEITFDGTSYAVGEYVPYYTTTSLLVDLGSIEEVNGITFMHSTSCLTKLCFDDMYFGGSKKYVSK